MGDGDNEINLGNKRIAKLAYYGSVNIEEETGKLKQISLNNPYEYSPKEQSCTVQNIDIKKDKEAQINAVIKFIEYARDSKTPRGLVLNPAKVSKVTCNKSPESSDFLQSGRSLGKGANAEVFLVKDRQTGQDVALKTIMLARFQGDEIRAWIHLGEEGIAPELYHFEMVNNKVVMTMEPITGMTLQEVIDKNLLEDPLDAAAFSYVVLEGLLNAFEKLKSKGYTHGDMHAGNVMVDQDLSVKILDFGLARKLLHDPNQDSQCVKNDVVGIISMFCALYSGFDEKSLNYWQKLLEENDFESLSEYMTHLPMTQRQEMFAIMSKLFDTVRDKRQENFGDPTRVRDHFPEGFQEARKKLAVLLFPERYQPKEQADSVMTFESDYTGSIWDNPELDLYTKLITDEELTKLAGFTIL
ncbi:uncharacterized protein LOC131937854 isoform X1 [Physella acuta]|uniref:uncharacterized protein LOC131937854 isoform X1 n=1 Tax=Physella acuta TaxID=109671 RepID=UPI0027DAD11A|nr:uncharacterized protein LOC131937854 isoform X1 [Physella acuta]XP_059151521.1 uncharacterized protein LOC131937854 isoform X1 [Physella acuta]XP_059151522.1 uncharacterized protein LOC131937854 isoform X1 [Physella acuta]XP_059151523.1 uncharacterized protein LOC131937854 isoform X1 [Physella acuta]XP_059151524.1 uncharacterized protein LOC131937854 isoform X1 [Physella acuta]XP_059151525.1 uncharacterized protein LOC131937854 isoform X1 [Physella acuta]XP_059151526.1 uncharacterized prot